MDKQKFSKKHTTKILRWTARILSLLMILLTLIFAIGEALTEPHPNAEPTPVFNYLWGFLMLGGLALAWKWELTGALISLIGFIGVGIVNPGALMKPGMYFFAIPAILFLYCWRKNKPDISI